MENKGLCETCVRDKDCIFSRKFPVLECEEFDDHEPLAAEAHKAAA